MAINGATVLQTDGTGVLSGGNLTYTTNTAGNSLCRTTRCLSGPTYWEVTPTAITTITTVYFGLSSSNFSQTALDSSFLSFAYYSTGAIKQSANLIGTVAGYAVGQRQDWAYDPTTGNLWIRIAGGNWNNNPAADPATGAGAINVFASPSAFAPAGGLMPSFACTQTGAAVTFALQAAGFAGVPPTGFSSIDVQQFTLRNMEENFAGFAEILPAVAKEFGPAVRACWPPDQRYLYYWQPASAMKFVSGWTKENGVIVPNKRIEVYDRTSGELIQVGVSDGTGYFTLPTIGRNVVRVVGSDPTTYNSIVWDNVPAI